MMAAMTVGSVICGGQPCAARSARVRSMTSAGMSSGLFMSGHETTKVTAASRP